jgi:hypothetical protein
MQASRKKSNFSPPSKKKQELKHSAARTQANSQDQQEKKKRVLLLRQKQASTFIKEPEMAPDFPEASEDFTVENMKWISNDEDIKRPFNPYRAGSIEQNLDMCDTGPYRGDEILHHHGQEPGNSDEAIEDVEQMLMNYRVDMAETNREGDEMTGDEHSSGLQGGDSELEEQVPPLGGLPGEEEKTQEKVISQKNKHRLPE